MFAFIRTLLFAFAGLAFAIVAGLSGSPTHVSVSQEPSASTSGNGLSILPASVLESIASTTGKLQESTKPAPVVKPSPATKPDTQTPAQNTSTVAPIQEPATISSALLNERVRAATVNILCSSKARGPLNSISASGVLVDPRGTIITNSHVGQYLLLKNYPTPGFVECTIRTGSPATPKYKAELLFLPPSWIADNAEKIDQERPTGNGEHDYAFLRITGPVSSSVVMPQSFPFLAISTTPPTEGQTLIAAGYSAGFLGGISIQKDLHVSSALTEVGEVFTFGDNTIDLFSIGGTIVSQQGASGGAVANQNGILMGIIVTATDAPDTASRDLRAITTSYIIRDFQKEAGMPLDTYMEADTKARADTFAATIAPALTKKLIDALENP